MVIRELIVNMVNYKFLVSNKNNNSLKNIEQTALPCILISPCLNGGTCANDNVGGYTCACTSSYTGTNCQTCNIFLLFLFILVKKSKICIIFTDNFYYTIT